MCPVNKKKNILLVWGFDNVNMWQNIIMMSILYEEYCIYYTDTINMHGIWRSEHAYGKLDKPTNHKRLNKTTGGARICVPIQYYYGVTFKKLMYVP